MAREALRDWKLKRTVQLQAHAALTTDIGTGLADIRAGRVRDFDTARIIDRGRRKLARRVRSG